MAEELLAGEGTPESGVVEETTTEKPTEKPKEKPKEEPTAPSPEPEEAMEETAGAPESYEPFTVPEGVPYDEKAAKEFGDLARELNLTQEQAQRLVDVYAQKQSSQREALTAHLNGMKESWVGEVRKEWGDAFDRKAALAAKGAELGDEALLELLNGRDRNLPGIVLADHPAMARFLARVGEMTSEKPLVEGTPAGAVPKSAAEVLYGTVDVKTAE